MAMAATMLPLSKIDRYRYMVWAANAYVDSLMSAGHPQEAIEPNLQNMVARTIECLTALECSGGAVAGHA